MAWRKTHNLSVKTGFYEQAGQKKFRYKTVGKVLLSDEGREMLIIDKTFNPAGAFSDNQDGVVLYRFEEEEREDRTVSRGSSPPNARPRSQERQQYEDDIPF